MKAPFYHSVTCIKTRGGLKPAWQARTSNHIGLGLCGKGNSADNAIKDLQRQISKIIKNDNGGKFASYYMSAINSYLEDKPDYDRPIYNGYDF